MTIAHRSRQKGAGPEEGIPAFRRNKPKEPWPSIIEHLSRDAVVSYKQRIREQLSG